MNEELPGAACSSSFIIMVIHLTQALAMDCGHAVSGLETGDTKPAKPGHDGRLLSGSMGSPRVGLAPKRQVARVGRQRGEARRERAAHPRKRGGWSCPIMRIE